MRRLTWGGSVQSPQCSPSGGEAAFAVPSSETAEVHLAPYFREGGNTHAAWRCLDSEEPQQPGGVPKQSEMGLMETKGTPCPEFQPQCQGQGDRVTGPRSSMHTNTSGVSADRRPRMFEQIPHRRSRAGGDPTLSPAAQTPQRRVRAAGSLSVHLGSHGCLRDTVEHGGCS